MSVAKCHKVSRLARSCCIMWFKAPSWQGLFSTLSLSVKTRAESREKKTCSWFSMKPKWVFVLALRNIIVTALDHLQWKVITPTLSSSKQFSLRKKTGLYWDSQRSFIWRTSRRLRLQREAHFVGEHSINFQTSCFWIKCIYVHRLNQPQPHRERDGCTRSATCQKSVFQGTWSVFLYVCAAKTKHHISTTFQQTV